MISGPVPDKPLQLLKCQGYLDCLTIARREAVVLERILARCDSTDMKPVTCTSDAAATRDRNEGTGGHYYCRADVHLVSTSGLR